MMTPRDVWREVTLATTRLQGYIRQTPLRQSPALSDAGHNEVLLKLENRQHTGSFKVRGAMNKLLSLTPLERADGIVAASTGNHGAAVAFGLQALPGIPGLIFVPENASPAKVAAIKRLGVEVRFHGTDGLETEQFARRYAQQNRMRYISPYNDPQVIGGQGTVGAELKEAEIQAVFVAVGGGGLIAGIAGYLKQVLGPVRIVGCSPENSAIMAESVRAGQILDLPSLPTLSDGTAGGLESGSITFGLCRQLVDEFALVSEAEIKAAMRLLIEDEHLLPEGAAGVAVAGYLKRAAAFRGERVAIVICGGNVSLDVLRQVVG